MEYVDGVTLRKHLRAHRLKLHEVLDIATQVAAALDAAHEAHSSIATSSQTTSWCVAATTS